MRAQLIWVKPEVQLEICDGCFKTSDEKPAVSAVKYQDPEEHVHLDSSRSELYQGPNFSPTCRANSANVSSRLHSYEHIDSADELCFAP